MKQHSEKKYKLLIIFLTFLIPILVTVLLTVRLKDFGINVAPLPFLPPIYASINAITAILLIIGVVAIKNGNKLLHEKIMKTAIGLSVLFLILYIAYHLTTEATKFGGLGIVRYLYFALLVSHICLSIITIPLVLISFVRAISENFDKHKQITKYTFPIWLYVTISGVIVYFMISPYYV